MSAHLALVSARRRFRLHVLFLLVAGLAGLGSGLQAQTAHFTGAIKGLGSGFNLPYGVAVDSHGNVFVADYGSSLVQEIVAVNGSIPATPTILTLGTGFSTPADVAVDSNGNVFVADFGNNAVKEMVAVAGSIPASPTILTLGGTTPGFVSPAGIAVDSSGNVFVADQGNDAIKEIPAAGGYTTVNTLAVAYTSGAGFSLPYGVAVDASGNVYVADQGNDAVKEILAAGGYTTVNILGSGFHYPSGVDVDSSGNVFVADSGNGAIKEMVAVAGSIPASPTILTLGTGFNQPVGVAVDSSGHVFLGDSYDHLVEEISISGVFDAVNVGSTSDTPLMFHFTFDSAGSIAAPSVLTQGAASLDFIDAGTGTCNTNGTSHSYAIGDVCTVDVNFKPASPGLRVGAVQLFDGSGNPIATGYMSGIGTGPQVNFTPGTAAVVSTGGTVTNFPFQIALDGAGNMYVGNYVQDGVSPKAVKVPAGGGSATAVSTGSVTLGASIQGVALDGAGNLFIADYSNDRIVAVTPAGVASILSISGLSPVLGQPAALAFDGAGNLYIADHTNGRIVEVSSLIVAGSTSSGTGTVLATGAYSFSSNTVTGVAVGPNGTVYIAAGTANSSHIIQVTAAGVASVLTASGVTFSGPQGVAVDAVGNVYVADSGNNRIVEVSLSGVGTVVQTPGLTLSSPYGVTVAPSGNIFVPDWNNGRIVEIDRSTPPSLAFAATPVGSQSSDSPKSVTVTNDGNASLTFPVPTSGGNPSLTATFSLDSSTTCPQLTTSSSSAGTLAAGASCAYAVDFIPVATSTGSGSMVLTDTNLNASPSTTQTIGLSGLGLLALSPGTLPAGTVAVAYSQTLSAAGGTAPYTYAVTSGSLPAGLTLSTGVLSGTPTAGGTFNFTITATDSGSLTNSLAYTLIVSAPTVVVSPSTLPATTYGASYSQTITASGGTAPYTYAVTVGALPTGITLSTAGLLSGTPTATGTFTFTVTATDASTGSGPYTKAQAYSLAVSALTVVVSPSTLPAGTDGISYSQTITASGGTAPYTYAVTSGALPAGISLSTAGALSGKPSAVGAFTFTVTATDSSTGSGPFTKAQAYSLAVSAPIIVVTTAALPGGAINIGYSQTITASGGTAPYTYAVTSGALPGGLTLTSGGTLSGTPNATGTFTFTVTATDSSTGSGAPFTKAQAYSVAIALVNIVFSPSTLPATTYGVSYSQTITASGGTAPYTYAITLGALPTGITLTSGGLLSGMPTAVGTFNFTITTTDASSITKAQPYTLTVSPLTVAIAPSTLPAATYGASYSQAISASGGTAPYTYAVTSGALPAGLALTSGGSLSGTPTAPGTFSFTVTATDSSTGSGPFTKAQPYSLTVAKAALTVTANNASRVYGVANPTFTGSVTGAGNSDTFTETFATTPTATSTSSPGTYTIVPTPIGTNLANYTVTIVNGTLTIAQAPTTTALGVSSASLTPGQSETLTATVTSASGTPTGTVTFYDGSASLGTGTLTAGVATLSTTALAAGVTHAITVTYSGDTNFLASSTSASTSIVVAPFDFTVALSGSATQSVTKGSVATYQLAVAPLYGSYAAPVTFTATGLPAGATASFSPASIAVSDGSKTVTVTIQTSASAALHAPPQLGRSLAPLALALLFLPLFGAGRMRRLGRRWNQWLCLVLLFGGIAAAVTGCGGGGSSSSQSSTPQPQTYSVTLTGTAGTLQHSATVSLTVN